MARLPRFYVQDQPLHVIARGNNRQAIFAAERDYRHFRKCLTEAAETHALAVHAYVFMTNHVHLLATPGSARSLAKTLQSLGRRYVRYFNAKHGRSGTLWEGRYRATLIDSEAYFFTCARYIELNPVRAGMVSEPGAYPWSSFRHHAYGETDDLVAVHPLYDDLDGTPKQRQAAYRSLFAEVLPEARLKEIRDATNKGWVLGPEAFKDRVEALTGRRARPLKRGRPKPPEP